MVSALNFCPLFLPRIAFRNSDFLILPPKASAKVDKSFTLPKILGVFSNFLFHPLYTLLSPPFKRVCKGSIKCSTMPPFRITIHHKLFRRNLNLRLRRLPDLQFANKRPGQAGRSTTTFQTYLLTLIFNYLRSRILKPLFCDWIALYH